MTSNPGGVFRLTLINPVGWLGHAVITTMAYFGGLAALAGTTVLSAMRPWSRVELPDGESTLLSDTIQQLSWMLAMGVPLVGLVHIGMGSFLALQAYYGSTFVDGTGAVVGVGLARNLATLMTGLTLSGFLSARIIPELRAAQRRPVPKTPDRVQPEPARGPRRAPIVEEPLDRQPMAVARILGATVACPVLGFWGFLVGTVVGWQCADSMLGMMSSTFFLMFLKMIWLKDVVGLLVKGMAFGFLIGLIACFEGLRGDDGSDDGIEAAPDRGAKMNELARSVFRAACLSMIAVLIANSSWFILAYHSVPSWGPTLLKPPSP